MRNVKFWNRGVTSACLTFGASQCASCVKLVNAFSGAWRTKSSLSQTLALLLETCHFIPKVTVDNAMSSLWIALPFTVIEVGLSTRMDLYSIATLF